MKYFILTIFCNLLSSVHLQETNNAGDNNLMKQQTGKTVGDVWPVQTIHTNKGNFYGQEQRNVIAKPCSRHSNPEGEAFLEQQWDPTFASKFVEPVVNSDSTNFKPQNLKNEDHNLKTTNNQEYSSNPSLNGDGARLYKTRNSLSVSNPSVDSFEESIHELIIDNNEKTEPAKELRSATSSEFDSYPRSAYIPNDYISTVGNVIHSELPDRFRSLPTSEFHGVPAANNLGSEPVKTINSVPVNTLARTEPKKQVPVSQVIQVTSAVPNKCSDTKERNNLIGHSRRSMSSYNDDQTGIAKDIFSNDKELQNNNDINEPYQESRIDNENAMASVLNTEPKLNTQNLSKDINLSNMGKPKSPSDQLVTHVGRPQFNQARREMIEPAKGAGISDMGKSGLMLLQTERICYACSTANNPTCWSPDRRTTVKYCRKGNNACITKTFGSGSTFTLIRDCGRSCDDSEMGGLMPRYKSCSMCHSELCNGAYSINGHSIILASFLIALIKYLN